MKKREYVAVGLGILAIVAFAAGFTLLIEFVIFPNAADVPDEIPEGHHAAYGDYDWEVIIDPWGENWQFYTDTQPTFSFQAGEEGTAQTVVCMENCREKRDGKDRYYIGDKPRCVGGEGKIDIIPQGWEVQY